jgi:hypothetical protein
LEVFKDYDYNGNKLTVKEVTLIDLAFYFWWW